MASLNIILVSTFNALKKLNIFKIQIYLEFTTEKNSNLRLCKVRNNLLNMFLTPDTCFGWQIVSRIRAGLLIIPDKVTVGCCYNYWVCPHPRYLGTQVLGVRLGGVHNY